jgi:replication-associated recombination protein RarA
VTSALQKCIRRGEETQAVQWAVELDQSGLGDYCWQRLLIITSEDVGVAWVEGPSVIRSLYATYMDLRARNGEARPERLMLCHAAALLARAPKSRLMDDAVWATYGMRKPMHPEIPDYALDSHTRRGKAMGRGQNFWDEAFKCENAVDDPFSSVYQDHGLGDGENFDKQWSHEDKKKQDSLF